MSRTSFMFAISAGVALAVPYLLYARRSRDRSRVFGAGLIVAALIYVGFAIAGGHRTDLLVELGGVVLFAAFAFLGVRHSIHWLALGWVSHVAWDVVLHPADWWYPVACIGFDLVVAGAIIGMSWQGKPPAYP
jgi:hypothetical protein